MDALELSPWNPCLTSQLPCLQLLLGTQPVEHVKNPEARDHSHAMATAGPWLSISLEPKYDSALS